MNKEFNLINYLTKERDKGILIWIFNIGTEKYWNPDNTNVTIMDREEEKLVNKIEEISLLLTRKQDYLILREKPDQEFLDILSSYGFEIPNILSPKENALEKTISELILKDNELLRILKELGRLGDVSIVPYGISKLEEKISEICGLHIMGAHSELIKQINNKVNSRNIAEVLGFQVPEGTVCSSLEEIEKAYYARKETCSKLVVKNSVGASGKGIFIIENNTDFKTIMLILKRMVRKGQCFEWVMEEWYEKKMDINYQVYVASDGKVIVFSIKEQIVDKTIYVGSVMPPRISEELQNIYIEYGQIIGKYLYKQGFTGVLGVDSIISKQNEIIPIIEINARFTLSTYLSFLCDKYPSKLICSFYEKVHLSKDMNYTELIKYLKTENVIFHAERMHGIIVYVAATLLSAENTRGRMFLIIVADSIEDFQIYKEKIKQFLQFSNQTLKSFDLLTLKYEKK